MKKCREGKEIVKRGRESKKRKKRTECRQES
jgi:hypothetical protein